MRAVPAATTVVSHDAVHHLHAAPAPAATTVVRTAAPALPSHIVAAAPAQTTLLRTNGLVHHRQVFRRIQQLLFFGYVGSGQWIAMQHIISLMLFCSRTDPHSVVTPGRLLQLGNAFHPGAIQVVGLGAAPTAVAQPTIIQA